MTKFDQSELNPIVKLALHESHLKSQQYYKCESGTILNLAPLMPSSVGFQFTCFFPRMSVLQSSEVHIKLQVTAR